MTTDQLQYSDDPVENARTAKAVAELDAWLAENVPSAPLPEPGSPPPSPGPGTNVLSAVFVITGIMALAVLASLLPYAIVEYHRY